MTLPNCSFRMTWKRQRAETHWHLLFTCSSFWLPGACIFQAAPGSIPGQAGWLAVWEKQWKLSLQSLSEVDSNEFTRSAQGKKAILGASHSFLHFGRELCWKSWQTAYDINELAQRALSLLFLHLFLLFFLLFLLNWNLSTLYLTT